jgi:hypothetical protein
VGGNDVSFEAKILDFTSSGPEMEGLE